MDHSSAAASPRRRPEARGVRAWRDAATPALDREWGAYDYPALWLAAGFWLDRAGVLINADARAAQVLAAAGIELHTHSCLRASDAGTPPATRRPEWLRDARIEPIIVGGERLGTLVPFSRSRPDTVQIPPEQGALPRRHKVRRVVDFIAARLSDQPIRLEHLRRPPPWAHFIFTGSSRSRPGRRPTQRRSDADQARAGSSRRIALAFGSRLLRA